jgi:hypothetical protein
MVDLDLDGLLDLVETNGFGGDWSNQPSYMYLNQSGLEFIEVGVSLGFSHFGQGRSLIQLDFDNDGDRDLIVCSSGESLKVFENHQLEPGEPVSPNANWFDLRLDTSARRTLAPMGQGSHVTLTINGQRRHYYADGGFGYCVQNEPGVHIGLGSASIIDAVRIEWADGSFTTRTSVNANQRLTVRAPYHPADVDGSGLVDVFDVMWFISGYASNDLVCDQNGDGMLSVFDLLRFLNDLASEG